MKVRFILSLLVALFIAGSIFASVDVVKDPVNIKGLVLTGEVGRETGRSAIPVIPIKAFIIDNNTISIQYEAILGTVQVFVDGQLQEVDEVSVIGQTTSFSVAHLLPGTYKLELRTLTGGYVYGDFVIEEE